MPKMEKKDVVDFKSFLQFVINDDIKTLPDLFLTLIEVLPDQIRTDFYSKAYRDISKVMENDKKVREPF